MGKRKKATGLIQLPLHFAIPEFEEVWQLWRKEREEQGHPLTPTSEAMQIKKLEHYPVQIAIAAIRSSIEHNWRGIFPESINERDQQRVGKFNGQREIITRDAIDRAAAVPNPRPN